MNVWAVLYIAGLIAGSVLYPSLDINSCTVDTIMFKDQFQHSPQFLAAMKTTPDQIDVRCIVQDTKPEREYFPPEENK